MLGSTETTFYTIAVYFGASGHRQDPLCRPGSPLRRPGGLYGCCLGGAGDLLLAGAGHAQTQIARKAAPPGVQAGAAFVQRVKSSSFSLLKSVPPAAAAPA